jgi:hypothetical protein
LPAIVIELAFNLKQDREIYFARHLFTFLFFCVGVLAVYKMAARRFGDWRIGLIAATFLILSPRIFADAFYNSKDLVFLSVFAIAMNTTVSFVIKPNWKSAMLHGLACAIAIDTRLMAVIIPALTIIVLGINSGVASNSVTESSSTSYPKYLYNCFIVSILRVPPSLSPSRKADSSR